jgi:hypothetical protein
VTSRDAINNFSCSPSSDKNGQHFEKKNEILAEKKFA